MINIFCFPSQQPMLIKYTQYEPSSSSPHTKTRLDTNPAPAFSYDMRPCASIRYLTVRDINSNQPTTTNGNLPPRSVANTNAATNIMKILGNNGHDVKVHHGELPPRSSTASSTISIVTGYTRNQPENHTPQTCDLVRSAGKTRFKPKREIDTSSTPKLK